MESALVANIPAEILYLIIQSLDPISLVNLSQTSTLLRWLINPRPSHFAQRLLALELTPEHGGIIPLFRARDNTISPPTDCQIWEHNKYACPGCMKLLPHQMFDNHSILGLGLRKPPPGSEEAEKLTDWEPPGDHVARWKHLQSQANAEIVRLEKWRQQYIVAIRCNRQLVNGFLAVAEDDARDDANAEAAERVLCGRSRHKRRCIECKRTRGVYSRHSRSNMGTAEIPVIKSRQVHVRDDLSRSFPRTIYPDIPEPPSPRIFKIMRPEARSHIVTKLVIFCRHCSTWQELSDFHEPWTMEALSLRKPMDSDSRDPRVGKSLSEISCNHCFALKYGLENLTFKLARLCAWKAGETLHDIRNRLLFGWERICKEFCEEGGTLNKHKYKATMRVILGSCRGDSLGKIRERFRSSCVNGYGSMDPRKGLGYGWEVIPANESSERERRPLRRRLKRFRKFLDEEADPADRAEVTDSWQGSWLEDYEENEECLFYFLEVWARIKENRQLLVDHALHPDRFRYPRPPLTTEQQEILTRRGETQQRLAKEWARDRLPFYRRLVKKGKPWRINPRSHDCQGRDMEGIDESSEDSDELVDEYDELGDDIDASTSLKNVGLRIRRTG